jgi:DNA polymerase-3 subunit alpha
MAIYLAECRRMGIEVAPPDVNESSHDFTPSGTGIRFGLSAIRNVGANVVCSIVDTRAAKGRYRSFVDFLKKSEAVVRKKRTVDSLIKAGAFDSLGHTRRGLVQRHEQAVDAVIGLTRHEATGQYDLFGDETGGDVAATSIGLDMRFSTEEWPSSVLLGFERQVLGRYVSSHLLADTAPLLGGRAGHTIAALASDECADGSVVAIAGIVSGLRRGRTRTGGEYAIATVEDRDSSVEVMLFPTEYETFGAHLREHAIVAIKGRLDKKGRTPRLVATELIGPQVTDP